MPYVKVEDGIFRNPKVVSVGSNAKLLYIAGICYAGSALTDGFIPTNTIKMLAADTAISSVRKAVGDLVKSGLWTEVDDGYQIHDYLAYNESAQKVQAKKDAARDRMNKRRSQNEQRSSDDVRANNDVRSREVREPTTTTTTTTFSDEKDTPQPPQGGQPPPPDIPDETDDVNYSLEFEAFMRAYPKRVGKGAAYRAWRKLKPSQALQRRMVDAVRSQSTSSQWQRDNGKYIPNPATWINEARWDDDLSGPTLVRRVVV